MTNTFLGILVGIVVAALAIIAWRTVPTRVRIYRTRYQARQARKQHERLISKQEAEAAEMAEINDIPDEDLRVEEPRRAIVIDPDNPPTWRVYTARSGAPAPPCSCHGIPFQPGQKVLMWPIPNHPEGAFDLFCERALQEAQGG